MEKQTCPAWFSPAMITRWACLEYPWFSTDRVPQTHVPSAFSRSCANISPPEKTLPGGWGSPCLGGGTYGMEGRSAGSCPDAALPGESAMVWFSMLVRQIIRDGAADRRRDRCFKSQANRPKRARALARGDRRCCGGRSIAASRAGFCSRTWNTSPASCCLTTTRAVPTPCMRIGGCLCWIAICLRHRVGGYAACGVDILIQRCGRKGLSASAHEQRASNASLWRWQAQLISTTATASPAT